MALLLEDLEPINDRESINSYLHYSVEAKEVFYGSIKDSTVQFLAQPLEYSKKTGSLVLDIRRSSVVPEKFRNQLNETEERSLVLSFKSQGTLFFIRAKLDQLNKGEMTVIPTGSLFKFQRRRNFRFRPRIAQKIRLELPPLLAPYIVELKILDLSAGGISFYIEADPELTINAKVDLQHSRLYFSQHSHPVDLKLISLQEMPKTKTGCCYKIGAEFVKIPGILEKEIAKSALQYAQIMYARRL